MMMSKNIPERPMYSVRLARQGLAILFCIACGSFASVSWADIPPPVQCTASSHPGDSCSDFGEKGVCIEIAGAIQCRSTCTTANTPCGGLDIGCTIYNAEGKGGTGQCLYVPGATGLYCVPASLPCTDKAEGADCTFETGAAGKCAKASVQECSELGAKLVCHATTSSPTSSNPPSSNPPSEASSGCTSVPAGRGNARALALLGALSILNLAIRRRKSHPRS